MIALAWWQTAAVWTLVGALATLVAVVLVVSQGGDDEWWH